MLKYLQAFTRAPVIAVACNDRCASFAKDAFHDSRQLVNR
jgi:hypothetical protein